MTDNNEPYENRRPPLTVQDHNEDNREDLERESRIEDLLNDLLENDRDILEELAQ